MSYLITCAGSKRNPINYNPSTLEALSFNNELRQARAMLIEMTNIQLNWNYTLPAWQLYSGPHSQLYPRIKEAHWTSPSTHIKILSALFGWVKHTDLLPYYDLKMSDKITNTESPIWRYWYIFNSEVRLFNSIINEHDIDLLSGDYRRAVHGNKNLIATDPGRTFHGYGAAKGRWLDIQLSIMPHIQQLKEYVKNNSTLLFHHNDKDTRTAIFDRQGFNFTAETQAIYDEIKDQPHLYVAWTKHASGYYYIGNSFQEGGMWQKSDPYHLGKLAYHLLNPTRKDEKNIIHWVEPWIDASTKKNIDENTFSVALREEVYISFIPFDIYFGETNDDLSKEKLNSLFKTLLIQAYRDDNITLLNVKDNK